MQTRGILGFRFAGIDKITYVNDGAAPEQLGEQLCSWFKIMLSWKKFKKEVYLSNFSYSLAKNFTK